MGLYVKRVVDGVTLYVGRGSEVEMLRYASAWKKAGWLPTLAPGRPQTLRDPYTPVVCDLCGWAGLNVATHHSRAHKGEARPLGPATADPVADANRRARLKQELMKSPRAGQLVIYQQSNFAVEVFRIERISDDSASLRRLGGSISMGAPLVHLDVEDLIDHYLPVSRWGKN